MRAPRALRLGAFVVSVAVVVGGCAPTTPTPEPSASPTTAPPIGGPDVTAEPPRSRGSLRYMLGRDPEFIDPAYVIDREGQLVVDQLFDGLTALDGDLEVVPAVAESWSVDGTGTLFTFDIRPGVTFHDGTPVNAQSFVRAFRRVVAGVPGEPSPNAHLLADVVGWQVTRATRQPLEGVRAVGALTLEIELARPFHDLPATLAAPALAPVPDGLDADVTAFREQPIGNGPFRMAQGWEHDQFLRLVPFEDYWGPAPGIDEVVFQIYPGEQFDRAYADFREGRLQVSTVPADERSAAPFELGRSRDGYRGPGYLDGTRLVLHYYGFNVEQPPFDDPDVRRAISLLIDRDALASDVLRGSRIAADALVPPGIPGREAATCGYCRRDVEAARMLLGERELGPITLVVNDNAIERSLAERVAGALRTDGDLDVTVEVRDLLALRDDLRAGEIGFFRLGWTAEVPTLHAFVGTLLASEAIGDTNLTRFSDGAVDALIDQARVTADADERRRLYVAAERLALDQAPLIPMFFHRFAEVVSRDVIGFELRPDGSVDLTTVRMRVQG